MEEWKVVEGTKGMIEVSSDGRVRSLLRGTPYILKTQKDSKGYHRLRVTIEREKKSFKLHRIVAQAFVPNPEGLPQVNHIDGNKSNNTVSNLEWVTNQQNVIHAFSGEHVSVKDMKYVPKRKTVNGRKVYTKQYSVLANTDRKPNRSNEARKRAVIAYKDGDQLSFSSIGEAERYFDSRHIVDVLKGRRDHVKGWSFSYAKGGDASCLH